MAANPFDFDVTKFVADFRYKPFDMETMWAAQRRNIEALSQANQAALEGVQALARRQIELTREAFEGVSALMRDMTQPSSTEERLAKNTNYVKQIVDKSVSHSRDVATITTKAGSDAAEILRKRAVESLDEFRTLASQTATAAATAAAAE